VGPSSEPWAEAHDLYVRAWVRSDPESVAVWRRYQESGYADSSLLRAMVPGADVAADNVGTAYWSTFQYQRLHADVMIRALQTEGFTRRPPGAILVLDVGCGAGTAGFAVAELLTSEPATVPLLYVGWDHNATMRSLAATMLRHRGILPVGSQVQCLPTLREAIGAAKELKPHAGCALVTFSYFFRQGAVTPSVARTVASDLGRLVDARAPVRVMVTDATGKRGSDSYPAFIGAARSRYFVARESSGPIQYQLRYPYLYSHEGTFRTHNPPDPTAHYRYFWLRPLVL